jgi:hypothetical protein
LTGWRDLTTLTKTAPFNLVYVTSVLPCPAPPPAHLIILTPLAARLEGIGTPPAEDELELLVGPQRDWWDDRDKIVLLYEFVESLDESFEEDFETLGGVRGNMVR